MQAVRANATSSSPRTSRRATRATRRRTTRTSSFTSDEEVGYKVFRARNSGSCARPARAHVPRPFHADLASYFLHAPLYPAPSPAAAAPQSQPPSSQPWSPKPSPPQPRRGPAFVAAVHRHSEHHPAHQPHPQPAAAVVVVAAAVVVVLDVRVLHRRLLLDDDGLRLLASPPRWTCAGAICTGCATASRRASPFGGGIGPASGTSGPPGPRGSAPSSPMGVCTWSIMPPAIPCGTWTCMSWVCGCWTGAAATGWPWRTCGYPALMGKVCEQGERRKAME